MNRRTATPFYVVGRCMVLLTPQQKRTVVKALRAAGEERLAATVARRKAL